MMEITTKNSYQPRTESATESKVVAVSTTLTISDSSWTVTHQEVKSVGWAIDPGDAGEMAVRKYGKALKKLAES